MKHEHVMNNEKRNENYIMSWTHGTVDNSSSD
jgi:hypothetical protein